MQGDEGKIDPDKVVSRARGLAYLIHAGQVDKAGRPYIEHVARVAAAVAGDPIAEAAAWLHDAAEDHPLFYARIAGVMPAEVVVVLDLLNRNIPGDYYARIRANPIALRVKLADIADNSNEDRLAMLDEATAARLRRKYAHALAELLPGSAPGQAIAVAGTCASGVRQAELERLE